MDVESKIIDIVSDQLGISPESVSNDNTFKDLNADSLDSVEIVMLIEDEFDISIPDSDVPGLTTIGETIEYVKNHIK